MSLTQEELDVALDSQTQDDFFKARRELANQIIAANSAMFFQGSDQGSPNQHMQVRQFTNKAYAIAEEALLSEKTLQFKG